MNRDTGKEEGEGAEVKLCFCLLGPVLGVELQPVTSISVSRSLRSTEAGKLCNFPVNILCASNLLLHLTAMPCKKYGTLIQLEFLKALTSHTHIHSPCAGKQEGLGLASQTGSRMIMGE